MSDPSECLSEWYLHPVGRKESDPHDKYLVEFGKSGWCGTGRGPSRGRFRHFTQRLARESVVGPLSSAETWDLQPLSALALLSFPRLGGFTILGQLECDMCSGQYYSGTKTELLFTWWKGEKMQATCLNFLLPTLLWKFLTWECCDAVSNLALLSPWLKGFTASQGAIQRKHNFVVVHFCQRYGIMNILCFGSAVHESRL